MREGRLAWTKFSILLTESNVNVVLPGALLLGSPITRDSDGKGESLLSAATNKRESTRE